MRLAALLLALATAGLAGCSTNTAVKTRLDCFHDCKVKGLKWSGIVSRMERADDTGVVVSKEVCRCVIEEPL